MPEESSSKNAQHVVFGAAIIVVVLAGVFLSMGEQGQVDGPDWREVELTNVQDQSSFTIDSLEKPVLIESFAVWCSTCTRQQKEMQKVAADDYDVRMISLNIADNEDANQIRDHLQEFGFGWRYAVSPSQMTRQLVNTYGTSIVNPPSSPKVLICENSTRKLPNGVSPADKLKEEIDTGC